MRFSLSLPSSQLFLSLLSHHRLPLSSSPYSQRSADRARSVSLHGAARNRNPSTLPYMIPEDQPARILENHTLWRSQPHSFSSGSDPTLIRWSPTPKNKGGRARSSLLPGYGPCPYGLSYWMKS